jgi:hypothetical protein
LQRLRQDLLASNSINRAHCFNDLIPSAGRYACSIWTAGLLCIFSLASKRRLTCAYYTAIFSISPTAFVIALMYAGMMTIAPRRSHLAQALLQADAIRVLQWVGFDHHLPALQRDGRCARLLRQHLDAQLEHQGLRRLGQRAKAVLQFLLDFGDGVVAGQPAQAAIELQSQRVSAA